MAESGQNTLEEEKENDVLTGAGLDRKCSLPVFSTSSHGKARRSSLVTVKTGLRKTSFVSFEEKNTTIEIDEPVDAGDEESTENEDILAALREQNCDEEDDVPIKFSRKFQDSLKIKSKKSKSEAEKKEDAL